MKPAPDFVAGNTRLRARLPVLAVLAGELDPVLRREQGHVLLRAVPRLYTGTARMVVAVLLARHDLADTVALLRGAVRDRPLTDRLAAVSAVGALSPEIAADAAHAADGAAALSRLAAHRLPTPDAAAATIPAWQSYELHGDIEELETQLACAAHRDWERRLGSARGPGGPVLRLLQAERDLANLITVLRVPWHEQPRLLPYADLGATELAAASRGDLSPVIRAKPAWRPMLRAVDGRPRAVEVERSVRTQLAAEAGRMLRRGDVFGAEIAVGFVLVVEQLTRPPAAPAGRNAPAGAAPQRVAR